MARDNKLSASCRWKWGTSFPPFIPCEWTVLMQSRVPQEGSSSPRVLLPSACNFLPLNNEFKESAGCKFQFQPIRYRHPLQMSEWQSTSPWKTTDRQVRHRYSLCAKSVMPGQGTHQTSSAFLTLRKSSHWPRSKGEAYWAQKIRYEVLQLLAAWIRLGSVQAVVRRWQFMFEISQPSLLIETGAVRMACLA